jgi:hypothetical protein
MSGTPPAKLDERQLAGLCASCTHAHSITSSKGSAFIRCELSFSDPRFPRYPTLPVIACSGYRPSPS